MYDMLSRQQTRTGTQRPQLWRISMVLVAMRRSLVLSCLVCLLLFPALAGAVKVGPRKPVRCAPKHAKILVSNAQVQVYEGPDRNREGLPAIYGCARLRHRSYVLGEPPLFSSSGGGGIRDETLAGTMVAYEEISANESPEGEGTATYLVLVRNLQNGRWVRRAFTGIARESRYKGVGPLTALVLKSDGSVAWIASVAGLSGYVPPEYEVHALDKSGSRLLASGTEIDPHSLALKGSALSWTQTGKPFSAILN
jgi:hypothetical protein